MPSPCASLPNDPNCQGPGRVCCTRSSTMLDGSVGVVGACLLVSECESLRPFGYTYQKSLTQSVSSTPWYVWASLVFGAAGLYLALRRTL